jgi:hypothetical protein
MAKAERIKRLRLLMDIREGRDEEALKLLQEFWDRAYKAGHLLGFEDGRDLERALEGK